jgi:hypothetical protein
MKTFSDNAGRTWTIDLTIGAAKRVRDLLRIDLLAPLIVKRRKRPDGSVRKTLPLVTRLQLDVVALIDVIYVLVKPQADAQGVTDEQFGQALGGEAACAAHEAFMGEWRGFFHELRREAEAKVGTAIDHGCFLQILGNRIEVAGQHQRCERKNKRGVGNNQTLVGVIELQCHDHRADHRPGDFLCRRWQRQTSASYRGGRRTYADSCHVAIQVRRCSR